MNIARSSLKLFGVEVATAAIGFVSTAYFARELGAEQMGVFFLFQATYATLAVVADFGLGGAVEKRISEGDDPAEMLAAGFGLKFLLAVGLSLLVFAFRVPINSYLGADLAVFLVAAIFLQQFALLSVHVLQGELRVEQTAVLRLARNIVYVTAAVILIQYGFGVRGLVWGILVGFFAMLVGGLYRQSTALAVPSLRHAKSLLDYGKYNVVWALGGHAYNWMDVAVIGFLLSQSLVGAYEIAWRVALITILMSRSLATSIFPQASAWDAEGAHDQIEQLIPRAITASVFLVVPALFGATALARPILRVVFGAEYAVAWQSLIVLMVGMVLNATDLIFDRSLQALNRPDLGARATIVTLVVNLVLNVVLVLNLGIVGAAIATSVSYLVNTVLHVHYLSGLVSVRLPYRDVSWCVAASISMVAVLWAFDLTSRVDGLLDLFGAVLIGAAVYSLVILVSESFRGKILTQARQFLF